MIDFEQLLRALSERSVDYIIIGGVAASVHGSARLTTDLDIVYSREGENVRRVVSAFAAYHPYLRGAPAGLPFRFDVDTVHAGLNFALETDLGPIDLFGEVTGGGRFEDLLAGSISISLFGVDCRCVGLQTLIRLKRAAGRPKDLETISELEALREEIRD